MRFPFFALYCALAVLLLLGAPPPPAARADYGFLSLQNPAAPESRAFAIEGDNTVGAIRVGTTPLTPPGGPSTNAVQHAAIWNGTFLNDVHPAGYAASLAQGYSAVGNVTVGWGQLGAAVHAMRWVGPTPTDIHPGAAYLASFASGVSGNVAVGWGRAATTGAEHALRWDGTTPTEIHPGGYTESQAYAVSAAGVIVGYAAGDGTGGAHRAYVWNGPANAEIHPAGFLTSTARAIWANLIVGFGRPAGSVSDHALLWSSVNAGSAVDLHPAGFTSSQALAVSGNHIAGYGVTTGGAEHALAWVGAALAADLHAKLPAGFTSSRAFGINNNGDIAGFAYSPTQGGFFAVRWNRVETAAGPLYRVDLGQNYFLTASQPEYDNLIAGGWQDRGPVGGAFLGGSDTLGVTALWRFYHPASGDHFYTVSFGERMTLLATGQYVDEGVSAFVFPDAGVGRKALLRAYNPQTGQHRFMGSQIEYDALPAPWIKEGAAAYVLPAAPVPFYRADRWPFFFLTASRSERGALAGGGWNLYGSVGRVYNSENDAAGTVPLHRLYSPFSGDHFYTTSAGERDGAAASGFYVSEGVAGYVFTSAGAGRHPLYRAYNPQTGQHFWTGSQGEYDGLPAPWIKEGIAAYLVD